MVGHLGNDIATGWNDVIHVLRIDHRAIARNVAGDELILNQPDQLWPRISKASGNDKTPRLMSNFFGINPNKTAQVNKTVLWRSSFPDVFFRKREIQLPLSKKIAEFDVGAHKILNQAVVALGGVKWNLVSTKNRGAYGQYLFKGVFVRVLPAGKNLDGFDQLFRLKILLLPHPENTPLIPFVYS